jgi:hypothetical protein
MQKDLMYWYNMVLDNCGCMQKDENDRGAAPLILNLGTVIITLQPLYPPGRNPHYSLE